MVAILTFNQLCGVLLGEGDGQSLSESGYDDWKHATRLFAEHENSDSHRKAVFNFINRAAADEF